MRIIAPLLMMAVTTAWSCVSANPSGESTPRASRTRIVLEELQALPPGTAYDAIRKLHREWLTSHSATARSETGRSRPAVFVDGVPFGNLEALHQVGIESIDEIRFISPSDATTRYGTGYTAGIIELLLKKGSSNP